MKNLINKVKTNKEARKSLLATCGWSAAAVVYIVANFLIGNLIGGKLGESMGDFIIS